MKSLFHDLLNKNKKLNILQIGFYDSKISLKILPLLSDPKSKLYILNSWTNFLEKDQMTKDSFLNDLEDSGYGKQMIHLTCYPIKVYYQ